MILARSPTFPAPPPLLQRVRNTIRLKHYSIRTEQAYTEWIRRYVLFHDKRHPSELGAQEVETFLSHLAVEGNVAAATQNQAKAALRFLYREVLKVDLPWLDNVARAKTSSHLPTVLTRQEVAAVLRNLQATYLIAKRTKRMVSARVCVQPRNARMLHRTRPIQPGAKKPEHRMC